MQTLHPKWFFFFSDCSVPGLFPYTLSMPTSKTHTGSDLVNVEATSPWLLFCQRKRSFNNKRHRFSSNHRVIRNWCQNVRHGYEFTVSRRNVSNNPSRTYSTPHIKNNVVCCTLRISIGFSPEWYSLFSEVTRLLRINEVSTLHRPSMRPISLSELTTLLVGLVVSTYTVQNMQCYSSIPSMTEDGLHDYICVNNLSVTNHM